MKPYLSPTQLETLSKCGMQYYWRYIEGLRVPPGIALIKGGAVHASVERDMRAKAEIGGLLPCDDIADITRDAVHTRWEEFGVHLSDEEAAEGESQVRGQVIDSAVALATLHHTDVAPSIEPASPKHVERKFRLVFDGFPFDVEGRIDVQDVDGTIHDAKTASKTPSADAAHKSVQLTAYALARKTMDHLDGPLFFDYLVETKTKRTHVPIETTRNTTDFQAFARRIEAAAKVIETGAYYPCPSDHWVCCDRWCGYWKDTCPYGRRGRSRV